MAASQPGEEKNSAVRFRAVIVSAMCARSREKRCHLTISHLEESAQALNTEHTHTRCEQTERKRPEYLHYHAQVDKRSRARVQRRETRAVKAESNDECACRLDTRSILL